MNKSNRPLHDNFGFSLSELYAGRYELLHEHLFLCCSARAGEGIRSEQELKIVIETWQQTRYPIRGETSLP